MRHWIVCWMTALLALTMLWIPAGLAEEDWSDPVKTIYSDGHTRCENGTEFNTDDFGKVVNVQDRVGGWFILNAPEDGDYVFSVRAPELTRSDSFQFRFCDEEGKQFQTEKINESDEVQSFVLEGVQGGQTIYWWDDDNTGRGWTLIDPYELRISIGGKTEQAPPPAPKAVPVQAAFQYIPATPVEGSDMGVPAISYTVAGSHAATDSEARELVYHPVQEGAAAVYYGSTGGLTIHFPAENGQRYHVTAFTTNDEPRFDGQKHRLAVLRKLYDDDVEDPTVPFAQKDLEKGRYLVVVVTAYDAEGRAIVSTSAVELKRTSYQIADLGKIDFAPGEYFTVDHQDHDIDYTHKGGSYTSRSSYDYWEGTAFECLGFAKHVQGLLMDQRHQNQYTTYYEIDHVDREDPRPLYRDYLKAENPDAAYGEALQAWKARGGNAEREENVKAAIIAAGVGAHIRTNGHVTSNSDNKHSYIITSIKKDGIGIIQANGSWGGRNYDRNLITETFWSWDQYFESQAQYQDFYFDRGVDYTVSLAKDKKEYRVNAIVNLVRYDGKTVDEAVAWLNEHTKDTEWSDYANLALRKVQAMR